MTFELDDVLRKYSPEQFKTCEAYDVGGVNILNKKPVDSKTALDKIKRRREVHNRVERRRRDCINQLIDELTSLLPKEDADSMSKCHRVNVLRAAVAHIQNLTHQNENLNQQLEAIQTGKPMPPPAIITTLAPIMGLDDDDDDDDDVQSQRSYISSPSPSYTSQAPRSPISPLSAGYFSPSASPRLSGSHQDTVPYNERRRSTTHLAPFQHSGTPTVSGSSRPSSPTPSLPSLSDMSMNLPTIPVIIEPSEPLQPSSPTDSTSNNSAVGSHARRLNRQTLPRLQLVPPPFHHRRTSSGGSGHHSGAPSSPSYQAQDSVTSPASTYSGYSSPSGPWSSSSSSFGPFSASSSTGPLSSFGVPSPRSPGYSPYESSSPYSPYGHATSPMPTSPAANSQFGPSSSSPMSSRPSGLSPWGAPSTGRGDSAGEFGSHAAGHASEPSQEDRSSARSNPFYPQQHQYHPHYGSEQSQRRVSQEYPSA
ncbi:hypothetical protein BGZ72_007011 [Mortierella alpina]|nr:hypothetical protein BGZ72_007011 [Mortierella alpina]